MEIAFYTFGALAVIFSLGVVLFRSPVSSALCLVGSLFAASALFVVLNASFLGIIQILIYVGAILVLFLYVIMLLNLKTTVRPGPFSLGARVLGLATLPVALLWFLSSAETTRLGEREVPSGFGSLRSVAIELLGANVILFEAVGIVLLAGIVGVVVLALAEKREATGP